MNIYQDPEAHFLLMMRNAPTSLKVMLVLGLLVAVVGLGISSTP